MSFSITHLHALNIIVMVPPATSGATMGSNDRTEPDDDAPTPIPEPTNAGLSEEPSSFKPPTGLPHDSRPRNLRIIIDLRDGSARSSLATPLSASATRRASVDSATVVPPSSPVTPRTRRRGRRASAVLAGEDRVESNGSEHHDSHLHRALEGLREATHHLWAKDTKDESRHTESSSGMAQRGQVVHASDDVTVIVV
ncbi:hypothetical protein C8Q76DRAFT_711787 [Earliella scabrosa]|nr:hypothetical protein C8Q76DRAFT_711787 [Earliella scabrosa]